VKLSAGVRLSKADLEHGVLIGRADKCVDEGLRAILSDTISRVHVLLIREKGACHLYDVASLVGTYAHGQRVRCLPLADTGSMVQLASHGGVRLHWRAL
jgi:pSer/pThr/pTyr-binding forkhead associated (FHA) protein